MFTGFRTPAVAAIAILTSFTVGSVAAQELSAPGRISPQLQQKIATTYVVKFDESVNPSTYRRNAASIASRFSGRVIHTYENVLPAFAMRIGGAGGENLMAAVGRFGIASVTRDFIMSINAQSDNKPGGTGRKTKSTPTLPEAGWNIQRVGLSTEINYFHSPIKVCVIDTGIYSHSELNVATGWNIITDSVDANDDNGHGTHVAGIIGAKRDGAGVEGVAPGVKVVPIKVLDSSGSGAWSDVLAGVAWAADPDHCTIANMSLGGLAYNWDKALDEAIQNASSAVKFSIAAGNSAMDIVGSSYGYTPARASTGGADNIFTIASTAEPEKNSENVLSDVWSYFSNYNSEGSDGGKVDFALPGQSIRSTWNTVGGYNTISGTSMAAPHMAGLLVRYIDAVTTNTDGTIDNSEILSVYGTEDTETVTRTVRVRVKRNIVTEPQSDVYYVLGPNLN